jgi:hypothetical protein
MNLPNEAAYPLVDLALARRLERTEGRSCVEFVEARASLHPESGARWIEVRGAYAMYDGVSSPITQTFCLGIFQPIAPADLETIETFYRDRGAPVFHEVSPLADPSVLENLNQRGYQPIEFTSVMFRPVGQGAALPGAHNKKIQVRSINANEHELWAQTSAKGWSEFKEFADQIFELGLLTTKKSEGLSFLAELDGQPIATGAMSICDGVALLAGASTIPEARNQGAQLAMLDARLRHAAKCGCDIAMMCALPGSASQRNAERQGFHIAYTRIKWKLITEK